MAGPSRDLPSALCLPWPAKNSREGVGSGFQHWVSLHTAAVCARRRAWIGWGLKEAVQSLLSAVTPLSRLC